MAPHEARRRFTEARVARLATVDPGGRPHLVPVVFAGHDDTIVTAVDHKPKKSRQLTRLHNIAVHPTVCLLADAYDEDWDQLWWVRADGGARILPSDAPEEDARAEYTAAIDLLRQKYPQYHSRPPDGPLIVVTVLRWNGWRASRVPAAPRSTSWTAAATRPCTWRNRRPAPPGRLARALALASTGLAVAGVTGAVARALRRRTPSAVSRTGPSA